MILGGPVHNLHKKTIHLQKVLEGPTPVILGSQKKQESRMIELYFMFLLSFAMNYISQFLFTLTEDITNKMPYSHSRTVYKIYTHHLVSLSLQQTIFSGYFLP